MRTPGMLVLLIGLSAGLLAGTPASAAAPAPYRYEDSCRRPLFVLEQARRDAAKESSAILGFSSALGAYGGFIIPITFGNAIKSGSPQTALIEFLGFYIVCLVLTWWYYFRKNAEAPC